MAAIETYVKIRIGHGAFARFADTMEHIRLILSEHAVEIPRADCFASEAKGEAIVVTVYRDEAAFGHLGDLISGPVSALRGFCTIDVEFLGRPASFVGQPTPRTHRFACGIGARPTPLLAPGGSDRIEIFTQFTIKPDQLVSFEPLAAEMTEIVRTRDPGTLRYDWYYDDATSHAFALDTYADPESMFAHMRNCHDLHEQLIARATMVTEFLGALPERAQAAVARYNPYVLPLYRRLNYA